MNEIFKTQEFEYYNTDEYKIEKKENNFYCLTLKYPNKELLLSLTKTGLLLGGTITDSFQSIIFRATTINKLNPTINQNYSNLLNLFYCLSNQIKYLIEIENKCFFTLNPENIILIDNNKYIYLSKDILPINEDQNITIYKPFLKSNYNSPELDKINTLPLTVHFKTIYYSLAIIILEIINRYNLGNDKKINLKNTKLYFALKRCLKKKPEERAILFI